eukprot:scaffold1691_cov158-Ochromonas_danica.AAC.2
MDCASLSSGREENWSARMKTALADCTRALARSRLASAEPCSEGGAAGGGGAGREGEVAAAQPAGQARRGPRGRVPGRMPVGRAMRRPRRPPHEEKSEREAGRLHEHEQIAASSTAQHNR